MREPLHRKPPRTVDREPAAHWEADAKPAGSATTVAPAPVWQHSPRLLAQRRRIDASFGSTAQREDAAEHGLLQTAATATTPQAVMQRAAAVVQLGRNQYGGNPQGRGGKGGYKPPKGGRQVHKGQHAADESRRRRDIGRHAPTKPAPTPEEQLRVRLPHLVLTDAEVFRLTLLRGRLTPAEIGRLGAIAQVHSAADIEALAALAMRVPDVETLARLPQAPAVADIVLIATGQTRPVREVVALSALAQAAGINELLQLALIGSPVPRIAALAALAAPGLPAPLGIADVAQLCGLPRSPAELGTLAGVAQVHNVADLTQLANLQWAVNGITTVAALTVGAPPVALTLANIVQLETTGKSPADIVQLAGLPEVSNPAQMIQFAGVVRDRRTLDAQVVALGDEWGNLKAGWAHWPLTGLFNDTDQSWGLARTAARQATRIGEPDANALQAYTLAYARMRGRIRAINAFIPALQAGASALVRAQQRLAATDALIADIDRLLVFHNAPSLARNQAQAARQQAVATRQGVALDQQGALADQAAFDLLTALTVPQAQAHVLTQQARDGQLRFGHAPSHATIRLGLHALLNDPTYTGSLVYPNLNLTQATATHPFWTSLQPADRAMLNLKLAGFAPTGWGVQGYPDNSRGRHYGYNGAGIVVPRLPAPFPPVSGEIVHDWIFDVANHGHTAAKMAPLLQHAVNGTNVQAGPGFVCYHQSYVQGNRTVHTWTNHTLQIVIAGNGTVVTYYNAS